MIGSQLLCIGNKFTDLLNEYLDEEIKKRKDKGLHVANFPYCIFLNDHGFSLQINMNDKRPYIYLYIKNILVKWSTMNSLTINAVFTLVINDTEPLNIIGLIDKLYKFCGNTLLIKTSFDDNKIVDFGLIDAHIDMKEDRMSFKYNIDIPVEIKIPQGE